MWDFNIQTDKQKLQGLVIVDKKNTKWQAINFAVPNEEKVNMRGIEKNSKIPGHSPGAKNAMKSLGKYIPVVKVH